MNGNEDTISAYAVKMMQLSFFFLIYNALQTIFHIVVFKFSRSAVHNIVIQIQIAQTSHAILDSFTLLLMHRPLRAFFSGRFFQSHLYTCSEQKSFTSQGLHFLAFFPQVACYE